MPAALFWPCALAWLCAREQKFVEELDQTYRHQAFGQSAALAHLIDQLSLRFRRPRSAVTQAIGLADEQLSSVLCSGAVEATGRQADGVQLSSIDPSAWLYFETVGNTAHDAFFRWDRNVVIFVDVRIDSTALLRRWEERPAARLIGIGRATWDLPETLYCYARGTHVGYEREIALTREEAADAYDRLGRDLRTGALRARASLRANVPGAKRSHLGTADRDTSFWQTFSLGEVAVAEFDASDVRAHPERC